jgi:hypothetical protein
MYIHTYIHQKQVQGWLRAHLYPIIKLTPSNVIHFINTQYLYSWRTYPSIVSVNYHCFNSGLEWLANTVYNFHKGIT